MVPPGGQVHEEPSRVTVTINKASFLWGELHIQCSADAGRMHEALMFWGGEIQGTQGAPPGALRAPASKSDPPPPALPACRYWAPKYCCLGDVPKHLGRKSWQERTLTSSSDRAKGTPGEKETHPGPPLNDESLSPPPDMHRCRGHFMVGGSLTHTIRVTNPSQGPCCAQQWPSDGAGIQGDVVLDLEELPGYVGDRPTNIKINCRDRRRLGARHRGTQAPFILVPLMMPVVQMSKSGCRDELGHRAGQWRHPHS